MGIRSWWKTRQQRFDHAMEEAVEAARMEVRNALADPNNSIRMALIRVARGHVKDYVEEIGEAARSAAEAAAPCVNGLLHHDFREASQLIAQCSRGCGRTLADVLGAHEIDFLRVLLPRLLNDAIVGHPAETPPAKAPATGLPPRSTSVLMSAAEAANQELRKAMDRPWPSGAKPVLLDDQDDAHGGAQ